MDRVGFPLKLGDQGPAVAALHAALKELLRAGVFTLPDLQSVSLQRSIAAERDTQSFAKATHALVKAFQTAGGLDPNGQIDAPTAEAINTTLSRLGLVDEPPQSGFAASGTVIGPVTLDMTALTIELVDKGVGGDAVLAHATPDPHGRWTAAIEPARIKRRGKARPDLQARVLSGDSLMAVSPVEYDADPGVRLDITIPASASAASGSEYAALIRDLTRLSPLPLSDLQENEKAQDITYLSQKTGWDARAVALAAQAERLARNIEGASAAPIYAALRAGLPADAAELARSDQDQLRKLMKQAAAAGVIAESDMKSVRATLAGLAQLASAQALDSPAQGGGDSLRSLLPSSLSKDEEMREYATLAIRHRSDPEALKKALVDAFGEKRSTEIASAGRLAALTGNNAAVIGRLVREVGAAPDIAPMELVKAGLDRAEGWEKLIGDDVPQFVPGGDITARRTAYAEALAAQIRLAYPAASLSRLVGEGEIATADPDEARKVAAFLADHAAGFDPGAQPVAAYLHANQLKLPATTTAEIARLQRVWQITPDMTAMNALLKAGLGSAAETVQMSRAEFMTRFSGDLGEASAARSYDKAVEVHGTVLNLIAAYRGERALSALPIALGSAGAMGASAAPRALIAGVHNTQDVLAYGTLEDLFGELDFCGCDHCRSVLSPAAYLVDLLQFLDRPASILPPGTANPLDVLRSRRPDIEELPLSCENTSTPLPYIDLVNEALEHAVAHDLSLSGFHGFTTEPEIPAEELLASPLNHNDLAYQRLAEASYPPPLPFHRPLEETRLLIAAFDSTLIEVMEDLRAAPSADRGTHPFGGTDIVIERLGLSRAEYAALVESTRIGGTPDPAATLTALFGLPASSSETELRAKLINARAFCRAAGVSYEELVQLLRTGFVNPDAELLPKLERLGISLADIAGIAAGGPTPEFAAGADPADYGGDIRAWLVEPARLARIMGMVMLAPVAGAAGAECDMSALELRHADPDPARGRLQLSTLVRIARFIRLWRKLGFSIEETDAILTALWPAATGAAPGTEPARLAALDTGFAVTLGRFSVLRKAAQMLGLKLPAELGPVLTLVGPMPVQGRLSLYARLFLNRANPAPALRRDRDGAVLSDPSARLLAHSGDLAAALGLRDGDLAVLIAALGYDDATPLGIAQVSALHRHAYLARQLKLSVAELLGWIASSGIDPFAPPDPEAPALIRLIALISGLRGAGLPPARALALIWNSGPASPAAPEVEEPILDLARDLRAAFAEVDAALALPDQPDMAGARARLGHAFPAEAADRIMALLDGSTRISASYDHDQPNLPAAVLSAGRGRLSYDDFAKRLDFAGALPAQIAAELKAVSGISAAFRAGIDALSARSAEAVGELFASWPCLQPAYDAFVAGAGDPVERLRTLLAALTPDLAARARARAALALASSSAKADPALCAALLTDPAALASASDPTRPALDDFLALAQPGLSASYRNGGAEFAGSPIAVPNFGPQAPLPKPPGAAADAKIEIALAGWLLGEGDGPVQIALRSDPGVSIALTLDGVEIAMADDGQGAFSNAAPLTLSTRHAAAISLQLSGVSTKLALLWRRPETDWSPIPATAMLSQAAVETLRSDLRRLIAAASLSDALALPAADIAHLARDPALRINARPWLNAIPPRSAATGAAGKALAQLAEALLDYRALRRAALAPDALAATLTRLRGADPAAPTPELAALEAVMGWDRAGTEAALTAFSLGAPDLAVPPKAARVTRAMTRARAMGIGLQDLLTVIGNDPDAATSARLKAALRARYAPSDWSAMLRPIGDAMRVRSRDALVAFCLHRFGQDPASAHLNSAEKLYEYLLMDVAMQPCMMTSRVRHALSSVQTFIERCLLGLEARVSPKALDPARWSWMKRYRVWEANRKVFLFPENWLDPRLRDDQSPLFTQTMSALLQGDITEDRAGQALGNYLVGLDQVAKLQISAIYHEARQAETPVIHVIAHSSDSRRAWFYRRRAGMSWSPWTPIRLDIDDDPVLPVVWKDRLFLFWLKVVQEPVGNAPPQPGSTKLADTKASDVGVRNGVPRNNVGVILNWSELVAGEWLPVRSSDPAKPLFVTVANGHGAYAFDRRQLSMAALDWPGGGLRISLKYNNVSSFYLYNSYSDPHQRIEKVTTHFEPKRVLETGGEGFGIRYGTRLDPVLGKTIDQDSAVAPNHMIPGGGETASFFYQDARHSFFVETERSGQWVAQEVVIPEGGTEPGWIFDLGDRLSDMRLVEVVKVPRKPGFGVTDPDPVDWRATEDIRIDRVLETGGTVMFDGQPIGISGSEKIWQKGH